MRERRVTRQDSSSVYCPGFCLFSDPVSSPSWVAGLGRRDSTLRAHSHRRSHSSDWKANLWLYWYNFPAAASATTSACKGEPFHNITYNTRANAMESAVSWDLKQPKAKYRQETILSTFISMTMRAAPRFQSSYVQTAARMRPSRRFCAAQFRFSL